MSVADRLKDRVKRVLAKAATRLPSGLRVAIAAELSAGNSVDFESFLRTARFFAVESMRVRGEYGTFQSTSDDASVLGVYARTGTWAADTNARLLAFFAGVDAGTYVDVGANIGLTTVPVSSNPNVTCYALEPEPANYANLTSNVRENASHGNVRTLNLAAFHESSTLRFEIASGNLGDHRIRTNDENGLLGEHDRPVIEVRAVALDDVIATVEGPVAVKIDTQGAEPFVVRGARELLSRAGLLIIEFWPYGMRRTGGDVASVFESLLANFSHASLWREESPYLEDGPMDRVVAILRELNETKVAEADFYLDIVAYR